MTKYLGQKFNDWEVIGDGERPSYVLCRCKCGNIKEVHTHALRTGSSKSCGRCNIKTIKIGDHFGEWEVIGEEKNLKVKCRCSCGKEKDVSKYSLLNGKSTGCGHTKNKDRVIDLTNKVFGELTVKKYLGGQEWLCECSCGNTRVVHRNKLISGLAKKCRYGGDSSLINIKGKRFGKLVVECYIGSGLWKCKCDCGNYKDVSGPNLRAHKVVSCGCIVEQHHFEKEYIISLIDKFKEDNNRKPFRNELAELLHINMGSLYYNVNKYDLSSELNNSFSSVIERDIANLCELQYDKVELGNRKIISPYELDIYIPDRKLAIEFNGTYWHSSLHKDKYYHQQKTITCAKKGIKLIHVFEYEWKDVIKQQIIKGIILNNNEKIVSDDTYISDTISESDVRLFLDKFHLNKYCKSEINLGCYSKKDNKLLGIITFIKLDNGSKYEYKIARFCWATNIEVIGGLQKLFNYFLIKYKPKSVIVLVDISKFTGNCYLSLGFKPTNNPITEPSYVLWERITNKILSQYQIESNLFNEEQIMDKNNYIPDYYRIYNSGNLTLEWKKDWTGN